MILLIQFRTDQSGWHELKCFYETSGLSYNDFQAINAYTPGLDWNSVLEAGLKADKIILAGSGESGYEYPQDKRYFAMLDQLRPVLARWLETDTPLLGICLGHQILADTIGGTVKPNPQHAETGTIDVRLDDTATHDPLFGRLSPVFAAITAHKTSVLSVPEAATVLATTRSSAVQAFRYRAAYGVQFHPEMDQTALEYRLSLYPEYRKFQISEPAAHDYSQAYRLLRLFCQST